MIWAAIAEFLSSVTRAEWIASAAVAIALLSATYTGRNFHLSARKEQREIEATKPIVEHYIDEEQQLPAEFLSLRIVIRNRAGHGLVVDSFESIDPDTALILDPARMGRVIAIDTAASAAAYSAAPRRACVRTKHHGIFIAPGESATLPAHLLMLTYRPEVQLSVSLLARLALIRRSPITVTINVPAEMANAISESHSAGVSGASQS